MSLNKTVSNKGGLIYNDSEDMRVSFSLLSAAEMHLSCPHSPSSLTAAKEGELFWTATKSIVRICFLLVSISIMYVHMHAHKHPNSSPFPY